MKIWVIGRGVPTKDNRMMGSFEIGQARLLSELNEVVYAAQVFTFDPRNGTKEKKFSTSTNEGIRVYGRTVPYFPGRLNIHLKSYINLQWEIFLKKIEIQTGCPDIIHIHYPARTGAVDVIKKYKERGVKIVCTEHWTHTLKKELDNYELEQLREYVNISDAFICVGEPLKRAVLEQTDTKRIIKVIPNFVEEIFNISDESTPDHTFQFITAGRLVKVKQIDKVILAFSDLINEKKNVHLTIVGYGEELDGLKHLAKNLHLENNVTFTGTLTREDVAERISKADCLVCYSNCETFGVPVIEAWACGVPAIASDGLGFTEYWKDELGYIVDRNDVALLSRRMKDIISFKVDKEAVRKYALDNFSAESIKKQIQKVYYEITERA